MLFLSVLRKKVLFFTYSNVEITCCKVHSCHLKLQNQDETWFIETKTCLLVIQTKAGMSQLFIQKHVCLNYLLPKFYLFKWYATGIHTCEGAL
jgi:hypothetical protein